MSNNPEILKTLLTNRNEKPGAVAVDVGGANEEKRNSGSLAQSKSVVVEKSSFCWKKFLKDNPKAMKEILPVPVWAFHHVPLSKSMDQLTIPDVRVEYPLGKGEGPLAQYGNIFWIGTIVEYFGYLVKVRADGYPSNFQGTVPTYWLNYIRDCWRIGSVASLEGASLIPPLDVIDSAKDWRVKIINDLKDRISIHPMQDKIEDELLPVGTRVEVLDSHCVSRMRDAIVVRSVGNRVEVKYWDDNLSIKASTKGFWCHALSTYVAPRGWSKTVGHAISSPGKAKMIPPFMALGGRTDPGIDIQVGMKLEAADPLKPALISYATVAKVLKFGYMMVSFHTMDEDDGPPVLNKITDDVSVVEEINHGNDWFCYHVTSPLIFYCGFAKEHDIKLTLPKEFKDKSFDWEDHLKETGTVPLNLKEARKYEVQHHFQVGMKLEATDLIDTTLICVATVAAVKGRLLKIHFDGWSSEYDQWVDISSYDIFPVGWCDVFGYPLAFPKGPEFWRKYTDVNGRIKKFEELDEYKLKTNKKAPVLKPKIEKSLKRKASDMSSSPGLPEAIFDHEKTKAEAVKLGQRPKLKKFGTLKSNESPKSGLSSLSAPPSN